MFKRVFIENDIKKTKQVERILSKLPKEAIKNAKYINSYDEIFGRVKKPYLQKRDNLNLFLAQKKGQIVKEAPDAYGIGQEKHFYFINSYNCIYECEYCYLQGFFNSPDIVLFVNWDDIEKAITDTAKNNPNCWFHAGEFSDSLALSHLTGELDKYYEIFKNVPDSKLELRTKSINIRDAINKEPLENIIYSFSISSDNASKRIDLKTPSLKHRVQAIKNLQANGHTVGLHLDPIVWTPEWSSEYESLCLYLSREIDLKSVSYISIGVVRFTSEVYGQFLKNYPDSIINQGEFKRSFDNKIRYPKALRKKMLRFMTERFASLGVLPEKIYQCME